MLHGRALVGLSCALALHASGCAKEGGPLVVFIPRAPPSRYAPDTAPREAFDAFEAALQLPLPPEAMIPSAAFLGAVHRRLHPAFVDAFLVDFERSRPGAGNQGATIDFTVSADEGRVVDIRLSRSSDNERFDAGAIAAVVRASPLGRPPHEIVAPDGRVHLGWRFQRRGDDPCGVRGATIKSSIDR